MDIQIKLDGKEQTLCCTLKAAKRVNSFGGFALVVNRLQAADLEYFIKVAAAGLDKKEADIEEAIFRTGLPTLGADLARYVNLLANGGREFRVMKLKTVDIAGHIYAEVNANGDPVYIESTEAVDQKEGEA